ncbi:uncharacterized protein LOC130965659 [Arachis stenosperma]|uniref:uncharacterized protein LOC130965659 n=1 Tax=Arachis stenosperma TaxID=217475 RepID=UPI0025AB975C|nr:uncharacterized protein LOC130965659 [Arachis stenosperma]
MVDLNMPPEGSQEGSNVEILNVDLMDDGVESHDDSTIRDLMMEQYEVNPNDGDDADEEPHEIPDDGEEEEEMNYYGDTQIALTQPAISQPYDRLDHFTRLNLDAMTLDWSFTQRGLEEDPSNEFEVGQQFRNKEEVMLAVKQYSIRRAVEFKIVKSDHWRYNARCIQFGFGCNWSILISHRRKQERWEVRRYTGPHTCMQTSMGQDHRRLDSKVIAQHILTMIKADPTISIRVLQEGVENHFDYKVSYIKVWLAKQRVIARTYGNWEESYNELSRWLFAMQMYLPGTWVQLVTQSWPAFTDTVMFHRVFWTFPLCVDAFKHCKPLISIDGTHLYGKYGGTLLMAIAQDGNANILPIAFAFVEGKTKEAWSFFLSYLREHVTPQPGLHIAANFMTHFRNKDLKKVLINAVYLKSHREFAHYYGRLRGKNVAIINWLKEMPRSQWAQHADEGR